MKAPSTDRSRRAFLFTGVGAAAAILAPGGCGACGGPPGSGRGDQQAPDGARPTGGGEHAPDGRRWTELTWSEAEVPPEGQAVLLPAGAEKSERPVVIALHGRGEAGRGLLAGARGWRDEYAVETVDARLRQGAIASADLGGFVDPDRLATLQRSLAQHPYRGVELVTPYTPILADRSADGARPFAAFLTDVLWPRLESALGPTPKGRSGIDGVSMGGRLALLVATLLPERFASVGALQPALHVEEADILAAGLAAARDRSPFTLRLVSSTGDPFLRAVRALHGALRDLQFPSHLVVTPGPHDYAWNRGPGAAELLLHHERVLRRLPAP